ncbi:MAG: hypothetical protein IKF19_03250 [Bacilli bacterium]|nr:hypothetical protein [Bacilli bacterium]
MKILKFGFKLVLFIFPLIIIILLINYARLYVTYYFNKKNYDETFSIKGNTRNYVPQGLAYSNEYNIILQTSYNGNHDTSMLYIIDYKNGKLLKKLKLRENNNKDNIKHVGGITTDNNKVWIVNDYKVSEYSLIEILETNNSFIKSIGDYKLINRGDFCLYDSDILWIGEFFLNPFYRVPDNNPLLIGYNYKNAIDYKKPDYIVSLPKMVQGMAITDDNKFIFASSFTNLINSNLSIYDNPLKYKNNYYTVGNKKIPYYKFNSDNYINNIKVPPMAEGLFYKDNYLYVLFESSSDKYFYAYPKMNNIIKISINKLDKE